MSTLERKTSDLHAKGREWEWEGKVQAEEGKVKEKGKVDCPLETEIQETLAKMKGEGNLQRFDSMISR